MKTQIEALALSAAVLVSAAIPVHAEKPADLEGCVLENLSVKPSTMKGQVFVQGTTTCECAEIYLRVYDNSRRREYFALERYPHSRPT
jgi:hypothetical protein